MEIAILSGGFGKSLKSTKYIPKSLTPVNGIPLIERILLASSIAGIDKAWILIRHNNQIADYLKRRNLKISLNYIRENTKNTIDGFFTLRKYLHEKRNFYFMYGDIVFNPSEFIEFVQNTKNCNSDIVACVTEKKPNYSFIVEIDKNYKIRKIDTKITKYGYSLAGIYLCSHRLFEEEMEANIMGLKTFTDFVRKLVLKKDYNVKAYQLNNAYNVNTPADLEEAEKFLQRLET